MVISTSKVKCYKACKKAFYFSYIEELENVTPIDALEQGKSYHSKIEQLYQDGTVDLDVSNPKVTAMAVAYQKYVYPYFKVKFVEKEFEHKLGRSKHILVGRFDAIADDGCVVEHKSTSKDIDVEYEYDLQWDEQVLNYMIASGKNKIYYTVCKKPTIRQKQNESDDEFLQRCIDWYDVDTDLKIRVLIVERNKEEIKQQQDNLILIAKEIELMQKKNASAFYRNTNNCRAYNRRCQYSSICLDYNPQFEYIEFRKKERN